MMMKHTAPAGLVALAVAALPLGVGARVAPRRPARPAHYHVAIGVNTTLSTLEVNKFVPDKLTVHAGDSVTWTNGVSDEPQTVTFGPIENTPPLFARADIVEINPQVVRPQGGRTVGDVSQNVYSSGALMGGVRGLATSYTFTFRTPGTYLYRSLFHPDTVGEIDVVGSNKPASPLLPDRGPSMFDALRSTSTVLQNAESAERVAGTNSGQGAAVAVQVGIGDNNVSINKFTPAGLTIRAGTTVTWQTNETSGDPHILVFSPSNSDLRGQRFYTGLKPSGALAINPGYTTETQVANFTIMTGTVPAGGRIISGVIYGAPANVQSRTDKSYSLTFDLPGEYDYTDPFHPGMSGTIYVLP